MSTNADQLRAEANRLLEQAFQLTQQAGVATRQGNIELATQLLEQSRALSAQANVLIQLAGQAEQSLGSASSGEIIAQEAQAQSDRAVAARPSAPISVLAPDGRINAQNVERGTDDPVRTQTQTQSTPPAGEGSPLVFNAPGDEDAVQQPFVSTQAGASAPREDGTPPNNNTTAQIINARFNQRITPKPNVLDAFASYTYAFTWYLLTPDQYNEMVRTNKKNCATWQLLMQSGGAPTQQAGATTTSPGIAGRNKFFDKDYYMDDLEIDSYFIGRGSNSATSVVDIRFKVTEPSGISLVENLYKAVTTLYKQNNVSKTANYATAQYCLAVRFYGYDENGDMVDPGRRGTNAQNNLTDPRAVIEKFYPFIITNIKFRIPKDRVVEYQVEAKPIPHFYNKSQDRGTIPFNFELVGETVEQILQGRPVGTVYPNSPGERVDSPQPNTTAPTPAPTGFEDNQPSTLGIGA